LSRLARKPWKGVRPGAPGGDAQGEGHRQVPQGDGGAVPHPLPEGGAVLGGGLPAAGSFLDRHGPPRRQGCRVNVTFHSCDIPGAVIQNYFSYLYFNGKLATGKTNIYNKSIRKN